MTSIYLLGVIKNKTFSRKITSSLFLITLRKKTKHLGVLEFPLLVQVPGMERTTRIYYTQSVLLCISARGRFHDLNS